MESKKCRPTLILIVCLAVSCGIGIEALGQQGTSKPEILLVEAGSGTHDIVSPKLLAASDEAEVKKEPSPPSLQDRGPSQSEELGDAATKETSEIKKLKEKIIDLQNKSKLGFSKVVLCNSIEGFGLYSPFEPGQPLTRILLYFEPSNVSTLVSEGRFIVDLAVDVFLLDGSGKVIGGKQNMLKINKVSRSPILDLYYKLEYRPQTHPSREMNPKKPLREIIMKTVLHDRIKNQSTSMTYKINMESTGAKPLSPI